MASLITIKQRRRRSLHQLLITVNPQSIPRPHNRKRNSHRRRRRNNKSSTISGSTLVTCDVPSSVTQACKRTMCRPVSRLPISTRTKRGLNIRNSSNLNCLLVAIHRNRRHQQLQQNQINRVMRAVSPILEWEARPTEVSLLHTPTRRQVTASGRPVPIRIQWATCAVFRSLSKGSPAPCPRRATCHTGRLRITNSRRPHLNSNKRLDVLRHRQHAKCRFNDQLSRRRRPWCRSIRFRIFSRTC